MKSRIVLIRHGITTGNENRLYYGSTEVPLSERGKYELKKLTESGIYPDDSDAQFFTSGMVRTEQTFRIIYGDKPHRKMEEFRELDFGDFEMHSYEELRARVEYQAWITAENMSEAPPNGESIEDFNKRVIEGFEKIKTEHELLMLKLRNREKEALTVCVCHGGVICSVMNYIWPDETDNFYEWIPDPGHGYVLEMEDGKVTGRTRF